METLFWLDENMPDVLRCSLTMPLDKSQTKTVSVPCLSFRQMPKPFLSTHNPQCFSLRTTCLTACLTPTQYCSTDIIRARSHMKNILSGSCNGLLAQRLHILPPCLQILKHCSKTQTRINPSLGIISLVRIFYSKTAPYNSNFHCIGA